MSTDALAPLRRAKDEASAKRLRADRVYLAGQALVTMGDKTPEDAALQAVLIADAVLAVIDGS